MSCDGQTRYTIAPGKTRPDALVDTYLTAHVGRLQNDEDVGLMTKGGRIPNGSAGDHHSG